MSAKAGTPTGVERPWLGPILMIGAMLCFVLLDAVLKHLVRRYDPLFLSWGRCLVQAVLLAGLSPMLGTSKIFVTAQPWLQVARGFCVALTSIVMIVASRTMPLADIYAIAFAAPLIATMLAAALLRERATGTQWSLIVLGFAGVLVALRPDAPTASLILLLPVLQAFGNGAYHVLTRVGARTDDALGQLFYAGVFATLLLTLLLPWTWSHMPAGDWLLLVAASAVVTFGHFLLIKAFTMAPTAQVSPMVYFQIVWAALIGYAVFGDVPSPSTMIGAAIVIASGVLILRSRR